MKKFETYIKELGKELANSDPALRQDALYDAKEYLYYEFESLRNKERDLKDDELAEKVIKKYGTPSEIAKSYIAENKTTGSKKRSLPRKSVMRQIFGIVIDPMAWKSVLFMLISLLTGIFYFTWVVTGASLSVGFMVLIIGIPFFGLFLVSVRALALFEGRLIQTLFNIKMPSKPVIFQHKKGIMNRFKAWVTDKYTWSSMGYFLLMLPLGVFYFSLIVTLLAVSFGVMGLPIEHFILGAAPIEINGVRYTLDTTGLIIAPFAGFFFLLITLHMAKIIGILHSRFAKRVLIK